MIQLKILIELTRGGLYISCSDCTLVRAVCSHQGTATRQTVRPKPSTTSSLKAPSSSQTASQQQQLGETTPMQTTSSPPPKPAYRLAQFLFSQCFNYTQSGHLWKTPWSLDNRLSKSTNPVTTLTFTLVGKIFNWRHFIMSMHQ